MAKCIHCHKESSLISSALKLCRDCIQFHFGEVKAHIEQLHRRSRESFGLPQRPPQTEGGVKCNICVNQCQVGEGGSNQQTLSNFRFMAKYVSQRPEPPVLIASTLLVPGYIDEKEVSAIAKFIASLNPDIPYSLLGFHPHFYMRDLPPTSRTHARLCEKAAKEAGLKRINLGNIHLLGDDY